MPSKEDEHGSHDIERRSEGEEKRREGRSKGRERDLKIFQDLLAPGLYRKYTSVKNC